jgi:hypothetical protein
MNGEELFVVTRKTKIPGKTYDTFPRNSAGGTLDKPRVISGH